jgi:glycine/serine hydroxymethyltransferase
MRVVAELIERALSSGGDDAALARVRGEVHALSQSFPLYPEWRI